VTPAAALRGSRAGRHAGGFTLLEVMVALAILAMGLMALSDVVGGALRNHARAGRLDVATLLARGKMVELEEAFERKGFRDFDEEDEGSFEREGHAEVRWKLEVLRPRVELGPERILQLLTGSEGGDLSALLGGTAGGKDAQGGPQTVTPGTAAVAGTLNAQLTAMGEQIKKAVREVRLTVSWPEGARQDSFTVVTHLVVLAPTEPGT
jgi:general secretion pathway protein I